MSDPERSTSLQISLVVYQFHQEVLQELLRSLDAAASAACARGVIGEFQLCLIDNGNNRAALDRLCQAWPQIERRDGHGNIGYGRGHNLSIKASRADWHLILNPDVYLQADALIEGLCWLQKHPEVVAVAPRIFDAQGAQDSGCKRYPTVLDLLLRGFAPGFLRRRFARRLARYEMRDLPEDQVSHSVPIISGCFMLFRGSALRELGGFDPRYFLYFEDFDLSLRASAIGRLDYVPAMRITHLGGGASRKGLRHILLFARSALRFFRNHGWRWR